MISASEWDLGVLFIALKIEEETKCQSIEVENLSNAEPMRIGCFKDDVCIKWKVALINLFLRLVFAKK